MNRVGGRDRCNPSEMYGETGVEMDQINGLRRFSSKGEFVKISYVELG